MTSHARTLRHRTLVRCFVALAVCGFVVLVTGCATDPKSAESAATATENYLEALAEGDAEEFSERGGSTSNLDAQRRAIFGGSRVEKVRITRFRVSGWKDLGFDVNEFEATAEVEAEVDGAMRTSKLVVNGSKDKTGDVDISNVLTDTAK